MAAAGTLVARPREEETYYNDLNQLPNIPGYQSTDDLLMRAAPDEDLLSSHSFRPGHAETSPNLFYDGVSWQLLGSVLSDGDGDYPISDAPWNNLRIHQPGFQSDELFGLRSQPVDSSPSTGNGNVFTPGSYGEDQENANSGGNNFATSPSDSFVMVSKPSPTISGEQLSRDAARMHIGESPTRARAIPRSSGLPHPTYESSTALSRSISSGQATYAVTPSPTSSASFDQQCPDIGNNLFVDNTYDGGSAHATLVSNAHMQQLLGGQSTTDSTRHRTLPAFHPFEHPVTAPHYSQHGHPYVYSQQPELWYGNAVVDQGPSLHMPYTDIPPHSGPPSQVYQQSSQPAAPNIPQHFQTFELPAVPNQAERQWPSVVVPSQRSPIDASDFSTQEQRIVNQRINGGQEKRTAVAPKRHLQALAKAPQHGPARPQNQQNGGRIRGGRKKGEHLVDEKRRQIHIMRKIGVCWRCSFQRDECTGENGCCHRCMVASEKGTLVFHCNREKLPDLIHDFLPPSMTVMHQKQGIEDTVQEQVKGWDFARPIVVELSCGYGPAQKWQLYEFEPTSNDLLGQLQYLQDPNTGLLRHVHKFSPPLGLVKLDGSDDALVEGYLDELLRPEYLGDLGWTCFEEESQVDPDQFQARLLDQLCSLYIATQEAELKLVLRDILRMMVITYIMGHTLTIPDSQLPHVFSHIRHSDCGELLPHTSPRLANRQIKFYFDVLRGAVYTKMLNWQQQILRSSTRKEKHWLSSFCAILGFAMVLEEVQRTLQIQADAKITKSEMTETAALFEARNACSRIDDRFELLVYLFQGKYRHKAWTQGSFGPGTPCYKEDLAAQTFLRNVRHLLEEKREHLQSRKDVTFAQQNHCLYTSRLVARFLLPFLNLPPS
ncbi:uncharacterized protein LTR77_002211 [Saxophila tyrrhenica]|uniref:Uncharacterized protein n=1 Tax=Saxophila tyrrhenica TaxID=1690608 RepID=A0AAV9PKZ6_9PEZI|nr:hypothetical protein LTR77_002211 [Saxophila tyrrhenica]